MHQRSSKTVQHRRGDLNTISSIASVSVYICATSCFGSRLKKTFAAAYSQIMCIQSNILSNMLGSQGGLPQRNALLDTEVQVQTMGITSQKARQFRRSLHQICD